METAWFCLVAFTIAMYVVFDGFDLGAGAVHLLVARGDRERRAVLRSIGPVWDGNEVWLLAAGGTMYFAFPTLYASSFSGFYLPLMMVLWLLVLRGIAVEFRNHVDSPAWIPLWDVVFSVSSLLLALFYGVALGNVVRGVPLGADGWFFEPLWTNFRIGPRTGILDWYTVSVGLAALSALVLHGVVWIAVKTEGEPHRRAAGIARTAWWSTAVLTAVITLLTWQVQPRVPESLAARPWGWVFPGLAVLGLVGVRMFLARGREVHAFLASCTYLMSMLASAAFGLHPYVLPSVADPRLGLTVAGVAAPRYGLAVGLAWWIPGMLLVTAYFVYTYRTFSGKVRIDGEGY